MRKIDTIIIHCSATRCGADFSAADINSWHVQRGFQEIGYHYVIRLDGTIETGRPVEIVGAHCKGWNNYSIGICYVGGLDVQGHPADTRTDAQKRAMRELVNRLRAEYPIKKIIGHRDTSLDCNGDGRVESWEYVKECPCFDVGVWLRNGMRTLLLLVLLAGCGSHRSLSESQEDRKLQIVHSLSADSVMLQSKVEENDETIEECVEQIAWKFTTDTVTGQHNLSQASRTCTKRIKKRNVLKNEEQSYAQKQVVSDSLRTTGQVRQSRIQNTDTGGFQGWKWVFVILPAVALLCYLFLKRKLLS